MVALKDYDDYEKIIDIKSLVKKFLDNFNWREEVKILKQKEKKFSELTSWFACSYQGTRRVIESSSPGLEIDESTESVLGSELLSIDLQLIDDLKFFELKSKISELQGIDYAGLMFISPGSHIPTHIDENVISVIATINIEEDNTEKVYLTVEKNLYYFNKDEIFVFDSSVPHSAKNLSSKDWNIFVLRIEKKYFIG
jgi:hypothetical protein